MKKRQFLCRSIIAIFILSVYVATAQTPASYEKQRKNANTQTLYINTKDSLIRFETYINNKPESFNPNLVYYWYKSNGIMKTTGGADGRLLNGDYSCFYPDNNLKEKGRFKKGVKDGPWTSWYENGKIRELTHWKNGVTEGSHIIYSREGNVELIETFKQGTVQQEKEKGVSIRELRGRKTEKTKPVKQDMVNKQK